MVVSEPDIKHDDEVQENKEDSENVPDSGGKKISRKLSKRFVTMEAYYHEDGKICPRTIKEYCADHDEKDINNPEIVQADASPLNLNSVPGFPGVGGFGYAGGFSDGMPGMNYSRFSSMEHGAEGMNFGGGFGGDMGMGGHKMSYSSMMGGMGGGMDMSGMGADIAGMDGLDLESLGIDANSDIGKLLSSEIGGAGGEGDMKNAMFGVGPTGMMNPMMGAGLGGNISPMMGQAGGNMNPMVGNFGLSPGGSWPYDQATQMQLGGMNPEMYGQYNQGVALSNTYTCIIYSKIP